MGKTWKDICREKNGPDVCDSKSACAACKAEAARTRNDARVAAEQHKELIRRFREGQE